MFVPACAAGGLLGASRFVPCWMSLGSQMPSCRLYSYMGVPLQGKPLLSGKRMQYLRHKDEILCYYCMLCSISAEDADWDWIPSPNHLRSQPPCLQGYLQRT